MRATIRAPKIHACLLALALAAGGSAAASDLGHAELEALFGEPVTTSATGSPQRASQVPVSMEIITAEQIRRSGAHDIPAVLARYTSLDVQQFNAHDYSVGVRGYATPMSPRLLVLVNGRQVYLDHYGYVAWDSVPVQLAEIRQIEVIKGPNAALFGFNAAGGVINIITLDPLHDQASTGTLRLGSGRYREVSATHAGPIGENLGVRLSAGLRGEQAWRGGHTEFELTQLDSRRSPTRQQVAGEFAARLSDRVRVSVDASYSRAIAGDFFDYGQFWRQDRRIWNLRGRVSADTDYGLLAASVYHTGYRETYAVGASPTDHDLTVAEISHSFKLGASHTLRHMLELRRSVMSAFPGSEVGYTNIAVGAMWNWAISDTVESTAALRWDHLRLDGRGFNDPNFPDGDSAYRRRFQDVSWNFGLVWHPTPAETWRIGASRGVSLPSLYDLGYRDSFPAFGYQDTGNPRLQPTVVHDFQLEYRRNLEAIAGRIAVTGFYQINKGFSSGLSVPVFEPPAVPYTTYMPLNLGTSRVYGVDLTAQGRFGTGFTWGFAYRLAATEAEFRPALIDFKRASPRHLATARLGWAGGGWELDGFLRYAGEAQGWRVVDESNAVLVQVRDQVSAALRIAYQVMPNLTVALEGENVLQERQRQTIAAQAPRRFYLSLRAAF